MKKKLSQKELAELRKREQHRKELEFQVGRDLHIEYGKQKADENMFKDKNPWAIRAINFFGTLIVLYIPFWIVSMLVPFGPFAPYIKWMIFTLAIISIFRKRSVVDEFLFK